ncbi:MAG: TOBE domain-containing protein [Bacteroidota bacterium]
MNTLKGQIVNLQVDSALTLVRAEVGQSIFSAIIIDTPETVDYLKVGQSVNVVFKETEVVIGLPGINGISLQNQLSGTVQSLQKGRLLSRLEIHTDVGYISSIVTSQAVEQLKISKGSKVVAMVKTNEVMLSAP